MRNLLAVFSLSTLLALASCVHSPRETPVETLASQSVHLTIHLQNGEGGSCSGTKVSHKAILTATHCFPGPVERLLVDGKEIRNLGVIDDGRDHVLLLFPDDSFDTWAKVRVRGLVKGERLQAYGNPGMLRGIYRLGYLSGWHRDMGIPGGFAYLLDFQAFGGDSGGGLFTEAGDLVGVVSFVHFQSRPGSFIQLTGAFPFNFSPVEWQVAGVLVK